MISKLLFSLSLAASPLVAVSAQSYQAVSAESYTDFDTFEIASYFNDAFDDLDGYVLTETAFYQGSFEIDYSNETFIYYAFPVYYDIHLSVGSLVLYYSNDYFNFYLNDDGNGEESLLMFYVTNYIGGEESFYFGRLNSSAIATYIENEPKSLTGGIIGTITSVVTGLLGGLGTGIVGMFTSLFLDGSNISSLGIWVIVLLAVAIALGAVAWVSTLIRGNQR